MTPLEEYNEEIKKARAIKEDSVARAEKLYLAKIKHAKNMLVIDQETCEHLDFHEESFYNYHRRTREVTLICKNCGIEK